MIVGFAITAGKDLTPTLRFPDPREPTVEGVIGYGGRLSSGNLIEAYRQGIFPWPHEGYPLLWFCPDERGIIDFSQLHLSSSFLKWKRKNVDLRWTWNEAFEQVIEHCQKQKRKDQQGTWITSEIIKAYSELHRNGFAHSLEIFNSQNELVGGIYGVLVNNYFSGESMFHKVPNASKLALFYLIEKLKSQGHQWMDIQMVTSVTKSFGGQLISKRDFLDRIQQTSKQK